MGQWPWLLRTLPPAFDLGDRVRGEYALSDELTEEVREDGPISVDGRPCCSSVLPGGEVLLQSLWGEVVYQEAPQCGQAGRQDGPAEYQRPGPLSGGPFEVGRDCLAEWGRSRCGASLPLGCEAEAFDLDSHAAPLHE